MKMKNLLRTALVTVPLVGGIGNAVGSDTMVYKKIIPSTPRPTSTQVDPSLPHSSDFYSNANILIKQDNPKLLIPDSKLSLHASTTNTFNIFSQASALSKKDNSVTPPISNLLKYCDLGANATECYFDDPEGAGKAIAFWNSCIADNRNDIGKCFHDPEEPYSQASHISIPEVNLYGEEGVITPVLREAFFPIFQQYIHWNNATFPNSTLSPDNYKMTISDRQVELSDDFFNPNQDKINFKTGLDSVVNTVASIPSLVWILVMIGLGSGGLLQWKRRNLRRSREKKVNISDNNVLSCDDIAEKIITSSTKRGIGSNLYQLKDPTLDGYKNIIATIKEKTALLPSEKGENMYQEILASLRQKLPEEKQFFYEFIQENKDGILAQEDSKLLNACFVTQDDDTELIEAIEGAKDALNELITAYGKLTEAAELTKKNISSKAFEVNAWWDSLKIKNSQIITVKINSLRTEGNGSTLIIQILEKVDELKSEIKFSPEQCFSILSALNVSLNNSTDYLFFYTWLEGKREIINKTNTPLAGSNKTTLENWKNQHTKKIGYHSTLLDSILQGTGYEAKNIEDGTGSNVIPIDLSVRTEALSLQATG